MGRLIAATVILSALASCRSNGRSNASDPQQIQTGDLLFVGIPFDYMEHDGIAGAISAATGDTSGINFIHTAILEVQPDTVWIIDATIKRGVARYPLQDFLHDFKFKDGTYPHFEVLRLKDNSRAKTYLEQAKAYIGETYDKYFIHDNGMHYCTELVYDAYVHDGVHEFDTVPMNFKNPDGEMPRYWEELFASIGAEIPQDQPGTNPQQFHSCDKLTPTGIDITKLCPATLVLERIMEVAGRQGVACDGKYYYVSGSTALYKYTLDGELVMMNEHPFETLDLPANHIGDIDVYNGEIYAGIETFMDGVGTNIQAAVYSCEDLCWKRSILWEPSSGQVEVCGLAVDPVNGKIYMADWVSGSHLYRYNLADGCYDTKIQLDPSPALQQGIAVHEGKMYISCDDGDAEADEADTIYYYDIAQAEAACQVADVIPFRKMTDFKRAGEIEGLCFNPADGSFTVLANRGARIILGMPRGFYPGYTSEIHEVYIYR